MTESAAILQQTHELKTDPEVFAAVHAGLKTHEIRLNDRDFVVGDTLLLCETRHRGADMRFSPSTYPLEYTGRTETRTISHIQTGYGLADDWCILSFAATASPQPAVPQGWQVRNAGDVIVVQHETMGGALVEKNDEDVRASIFYEFAAAMLAPAVQDAPDEPIRLLREMLSLAISQNECDMVMTGEECRKARRVLERTAAPAGEVVVPDLAKVGEQPVWIAFNSEDDDEPVMFFTELPGQELKARFYLRHFMMRPVAPDQTGEKQ